MSYLGANLLIKTLENFDNISREKQDESLVTYAEKLDKKECLINFDIESQSLCNKIRAFNPYPAMYFVYNNERFKIFEAEIVEENGKAGEIIEGNSDLIIATKERHEAITSEDIENAVKKITVGLEKHNRVISEKDKRRTAVHRSDF